MINLLKLILLSGGTLLLLSQFISPSSPPPVLADRPVVVLTFDDAVKSHYSFVAPLLKEYRFNATFFITYAWMDDTVNFMNWEDIAKIDSMGFEIGNHSWTHHNFSQPKNAFELEGELGLVEWMLKQRGISKPVSYAHTGNAFGPEAIQVLSKMEYRFARRGKQPEVAYGSLEGGQGYDPQKHHPLLLPTTIDFYPEMNVDQFKKNLAMVKPHEIAILQFHGVPDVAHPWVTTPPEDFRKYLDYLRDHDYKVISMQELEKYLPERLPDDPLLKQRYPELAESKLAWPVEVEQSRTRKDYWLQTMHRHHFNRSEIAAVLGILDTLDRFLDRPAPYLGYTANQIEILPYPGGRHPRIDFKEGMLSPTRGTKLSIFLPWDTHDYLVLDIPEAVFSQYGLTFLGHKHIPTIFDLEKIPMPNSDWKKDAKGTYTNYWPLKNRVEIRSKVTPERERVLMQLSFTNNTRDTIFRKLQTQVCVMLGQTKNFAAQTNDNKLLTCGVVAVQSKNADQWIITGWEGCTHAWGNADCPCLHADPGFPDCPPGQTVSISGLLWFYAGTDVEGEIEKVRDEFDWL